MYTVYVYASPFDDKIEVEHTKCSTCLVDRGALIIVQNGVEICYPLTSIGRFESMKEDEE